MTKRIVVLAVALAAATAVSPVGAQHLADEQNRRAARALFRSGMELFAAEKFAAAAEQFTKATEKDPLFTPAYYQAGQSYMNLQRYASAIKAFQQCIESTRALYGLAQTNRFDVEKQRDDEIREMRETVRALQQAGHPLQATRAEQHLHDLENQRTTLGTGYRPPAEALLSLGSAFFRNGDREQAEFEWRAAVDVNPRLGEAHNNLAVVYMQSGRLAEADAEIKAAEKAGFRVNPQLKEDLKKARARQ